MALFKISRGNSTTLPATLTDGWAYFCTDTGEFFIDYKDGGGSLRRKPLNAEEAKKLTGYDIATILNSSEVEIPTSKAVFVALANKSDSDHNHDSVYETKTDAQAKLTEAKEYTDTKTSSLASTTVVDNKISAHNTDTSAHNDIRVLITDLTTKVNNFLDVDDTTTDQLSEVLTLIENNKGTLESLTTSKVNVSDIIDNLTTASANKVLSANQGVALKSLIDDLQEAVDGKAASVHTHAISDVTDLQATLDGKSNTGHAHTVANITDLTATATELNYMDGVTSNVQMQLDSKQDKLTGTAGQVVGFDADGNAVAQDIQYTTDEDILNFVMDMNYVNPALGNNNAVYTDSNNNVYIL